MTPLEELHSCIEWAIHWAMLGEVELTPGELKDLSEYSCTFPTGVVAGKRWKRNVHFQTRQPPAWLLCEYVAGPGPSQCHVVAKRVAVTR